VYGVWAEMVETFQAWGQVPRAPLRDETEVLEERASRFQSQLSKVTSIPKQMGIQRETCFFSEKNT
jgi:hypothetical protein